MSEVKCYSIDIYDNDKKSIEKVVSIINKHNVLGVNPDEAKGVTHILFVNPTDRYMAYRGLQKINIKCKLNPLTAWVDEKYLK